MKTKADLPVRLERNGLDGYEVYDTEPYPNHLGEVYRVVVEDDDELGFGGWHALCENCPFPESPLGLPTRDEAIGSLFSHWNEDHS